MRNMKKIATTAVAALTFTGLGATAATAFGPWQGFNPTAPSRHLVLPKRPCQSESDNGPCVWDAGVMGNGSGHSFWVDGKHRIHYLLWADQKKWGEGEWTPLPKRFYPKHQPCFVKVDYTSYIRCADGFHTSS